MNLDLKIPWNSEEEKIRRTTGFEFYGLRDLWNQHNNGGVKWDNLNIIKATIDALTAGTITFSPTTSGIKGTTTNDNTTSGNVGEYISAIVARASAQTVDANATYQDLQSISLGAGDWDVSTETGILTSTTTTGWDSGISQTTGNSSAGMNYGDNLLQNSLTGLGVTFDDSVTIANYRQSLASTTTIYHKVAGFFGVTKPSVYGRISARRQR